MSRSWERMVQRNTKQANSLRKKQGKETIQGSYAPAGTSAGKGADVFKGRNIFFPVILVLLGIMFWMVSTVDQTDQSGIFAPWVGIVLYFALAALVFFRRPFLKVERARVSTIKFNRERWLQAAEIEKIILSKSAVFIKHKGKRKQWVFSKWINRYNTVAMAERLEQFGKANQIEVIHE
ncbi:hypothetical protein [Paenibacillus tengchongensis]|uniref:hypothetical protein n=1 Tax=Paenibacillus tengchongensis TaxID=2608684 RepID=UPI00124D5BB5|nr:hypothetical protein [Paenibacillus tengchongensis]